VLAISRYKSWFLEKRNVGIMDSVGFRIATATWTDSERGV